MDMHKHIETSSFLNSSVGKFSNSADLLLVANCTVDRSKFYILIETCVQAQCCIVACYAFNVHRVPPRHFAHLYLTFTLGFVLSHL